MPEAAGPAPVEYSVAVDSYLARAALSVASRRVYRISLIGWTWPLVGKPIPDRAERRRATRRGFPPGPEDRARKEARVDSVVGSPSGC